MSGVLKQSSTTTVVMGPFLDETDGKTPETGLSIPNTSVMISKAGAAFANKGESSSCTHMTGGMYSCTFNGTDTNTRGNFMVSIQISGALPVWERFVILSADAYDCTYGPDNLFTLIETIDGKINVAQLDLDTITGADGATLASVQGNYAPATDGDMDTVLTTVASMDVTLDAVLVDTGTTLDGKINTIGADVVVIDGLVDAIKAKTDQLSFTSSLIRAGIFRINDKVISGTGVDPTPFFSEG